MASVYDFRDDLNKTTEEKELQQKIKEKQLREQENSFIGRLGNLCKAATKSKKTIGGLIIVAGLTTSALYNLGNHLNSQSGVQNTPTTITMTNPNENKINVVEALTLRTEKTNKAIEEIYNQLPSQKNKNIEEPTKLQPK